MSAGSTSTNIGLNMECAMAEGVSDAVVGALDLGNRFKQN